LPEETQPAINFLLAAQLRGAKLFPRPVQRTSYGAVLNTEAALQRHGWEIVGLSHRYRWV
jgi:hypothetical protein